MKMEPIVSSETSAIKSQTPGNYPKRNKLHLQQGESLKRSILLKWMYRISTQRDDFMQVEFCFWILHFTTLNKTRTQKHIICTAMISNYASCLHSEMPNNLFPPESFNLGAEI